MLAFDVLHCERVEFHCNSQAHALLSFKAPYPFEHYVMLIRPTIPSKTITNYSIKWNVKVLVIWNSDGWTKY